MSRWKDVQPLSDGGYAIRVRITPFLMDVLSKAGQPFGRTPDDILQNLVIAVELLVNDYSARIDWLPIELRHAIEAIRRDAIQGDRKRKAADDEAQTAEIKFELLHRSARTKSGYVGVYANGKGFRAMGQIPRGPLKPIGTWPTAELAAWQRYLWYVEHKIPYGELAEEMELHRKKFGAGEEDKLKAFAINLRRYELGDPIPNLSDDDVELAEKTRRAEEEFLRAKPASVPDVRPMVGAEPEPASVPDARSTSAEIAIVSNDRSQAPQAEPPTPASVDDVRQPIVESADDPMTFLGVPRSKLAEAREDANRRGVMLGFDGGLPPDLKFDDEP